MKAPANFTRQAARGWNSLSGRGEAALVPQSRLSGPMPWVIAIMVSLMVIAAAAGLALRNTASAAREDLSGGITVQIVEAEPGARARQAAASVDLLRGYPGIVSVRLVPAAEVDRLIEPWLGTDGDEAAAVPVPALIDARLDARPTPERLRDLSQRLHTVAPAARVDAQSSWLGPVFRAIDSLQWLAAALVVMLGAAASAAVLLASRTALGTNRDTIEIVHLLGGTDIQIARVFQRSIGVDAAAGGIVGLGLGVAAIAFLGARFAALEAGMVDSGALGWSDWLIICLVPAAGALLAMLTARLTILRALRKMV